MLQKSTIDWDDFRFFLAVARLSSARKVAQALDMSHSTVSRRIQMLEQKFNNKFFERSSKGYQLTEEGHHLLSFAEQAEANMLQAQNMLQGGSNTTVGDVQFTLPDVIASEFIIPHLSIFTDHYPDIRVNLLITSKTLDIERFEADIGLRFLLKGQQPPENLVAKKLTSVASSFYQPIDQEKVSQQWLGWQTNEHDNQWIAKSPKPELAKRHCIDSAGMQLLALKSGLGYAMLPCCLADKDPAIERIEKAEILNNVELWLLWHPSHRKVKRFKLFREFISDTITQQLPLIQGR